MLKRRYIARRKGRKATFGVGFGLCLSVCLTLSAPAFSQTLDIDNTDADQPVAVGAPSTPNVEDSLPNDLQPEKLSGLKVRETSPDSVKRLKAARRNSWDAATLTHSANLSAASAQRTIRPTVTVVEDILPADMLTAEDLLGVGEINLPQIAAAPPRGDGVINLSSALQGALFDLPVSENVNSSVFKLDLGGRLCLGTADECGANETRRINVGYSKNITHGKFDGLNLQLTPRAGLRFDEESQSAVVGALVRIGDNLREGSEMKSNTWYFFAGADAEAITYTPNSARRLTSGEFHLQDRIIVGDAQAGLGYRLGEADLALTYFKRRARAENYSYNEDAAALSITWKR